MQGFNHIVFAPITCASFKNNNNQSTLYLQLRELHYKWWKQRESSVDLNNPNPTHGFHRQVSLRNLIEQKVAFLKVLCNFSTMKAHTTFPVVKNVQIVQMLSTIFLSYFTTIWLYFWRKIKNTPQPLRLQLTDIQKKTKTAQTFYNTAYPVLESHF